MSQSPSKVPITILGLGPMGQAMSRAYLSAGHRVTVWNRSPSRTSIPAELGAVVSNSVQDAVSSSPLVVISLTHYDAMYDVLGAAASALAGKVVANLSSDTPDATRKASRWVEDQGAFFLAGGVMSPPGLIGTGESYIFYSGARSVFEEYSDTLAVIGRPDYRGEDPALAQLWYQAQLSMVLTTWSSFAQAAALVESAGVKAEEFAPYAESTIHLATSILVDAARKIDSADHVDETGNTIMLGATAEHILQASASANLNTALPSAVAAHYRAALAAGHGQLGWTCLFDLLRG